MTPHEVKSENEESLSYGYLGVTQNVTCKTTWF